MRGAAVLRCTPQKYRPYRSATNSVSLWSGPLSRCNQTLWYAPGPWFIIKTPSYQYRKSHCGDTTVVRSSYLHNGISNTGEKASFLLNQPPGCLKSNSAICTPCCIWPDLKGRKSNPKSLYVLKVLIFSLVFPLNQHDEGRFHKSAKSRTTQVKLQKRWAHLCHYFTDLG